MVPQLLYNSLPAYEFINPAELVYTPSVRANGVIEMSRYRQVNLQTPVVPSELYVSPGDFVLEGQLLASIDTHKSKEAVSSVWAATPTAESSLPTSVDSELEGLARLLGIDASLVASIAGQMSAPQPQQTPSAPITEPVAEIYAPITGVVTEVNISPENLASTSRPAVVIGDSQSYIARVSVKESELSQIRVGQTAQVWGSGLGSKKYLAVVKQISPTAKRVVSATSTETVVEVELALQFPDTRLIPGLTARGEIFTGQQRKLLVVPYEAVHQDNSNREYVYVYGDTGIQKIYIETGVELTYGVEVIQGLTLKDIVLVTNQEPEEHSAAVLAPLRTPLQSLGGAN